MIGLFIVGILHLGSLHGTALGSPTPVQDPRVTIAKTDTLVSEILKDLSKQTGTRLRIDFYEQDLKATVLVKDRPLSEILGGLASVLGARWTETDGTKILGLTTEERDDRKKYNALERKLEVQEVEKRLADMGVARNFYQHARLGPVPDLARNHIVPPADPANLGIIDGWPFPFGWVSGPVRGPKGSQALVGTATEPSRDLALPNHGFITWQPDTFNPIWVVGITARYRPHYRDFQVGFKNDGSEALIANKGWKIPKPEEHPRIVWNPNPTGELAKTRFGAAVLKWGKPLGVNGEPATTKSRSETLGQSLAKWHRLTGKDVISDSFRTEIPTTGDAELQSKEGLQQVVKLVAGSIASQGELTLARHGGFWRRRFYEPPEDAVKVLEGRKPSPLLGDYVRFVRALNRSQRSAFEAEDGPRLKVPTGCLRDSMLALSLLAKLDETRMGLLDQGKQVPLQDIRIEPIYATVSRPGDPIFQVLEGYRLTRASALLYAYEANEAIDDALFRGYGKYGRPKWYLHYQANLQLIAERRSMPNLGRTPAEALRFWLIDNYAMGWCTLYASLKASGQNAMLLLGDTESDGVICPIDLGLP